MNSLNNVDKNEQPQYSIVTHHYLIRNLNYNSYKGPYYTNPRYFLVEDCNYTYSKALLFLIENYLHPLLIDQRKKRTKSEIHTKIKLPW